MGSLRNELAIPFRGAREAGRDLLAGLAVIGRFTAKMMIRGVKTVFTAGKISGKPATAADWLEAVIGGILALLITGAVAVSATVALTPRVRPYLPALAGIGLLLFIGSAWLAAPARPPRNTPSEQSPNAPGSDVDGPNLNTPEERRLVFLQWLEKATRGASGIHLGEIHRQLTLHAPAEGIPRDHIRPLLNHYGIPVQRTLRVGRIAGRSGVTRQAVLDALSAPPPAADSGHVEHVGDSVRPA